MDGQQLPPSTVDILIVDDKVENLDFLAQMLKEHNYRVRLATNGNIALKSAIVAPPSLILLDINMPEINGYEVCLKLKQEPGTQDIPVIFLSALGQTFNKVKAFEVGGVDYITKPFDISEVIIRIENQLKLKAAQAKIVELNNSLETKVKERTIQLEEEIIKKERAQAKLIKMALQDPLTELPNKRWFMEKLKKEIGKAQVDTKRQFAIICFDCDNFKIINDSLGHSVGDRLLQQISERLQTCLDSQNKIARLGGDEFIILLSQVHTIETAILIVEAIQQEFVTPFYVDGREIFLNFSAGIVLGSSGDCKPEKLLQKAELAMYRAKDLGKGQYQVYNQQMHQQALSRMQLETDLRKALQEDQFALHYQPIVCLKTGYITGVESLIRWQHPERGIISPEKFIPVAEEMGLILPIGIWVLREACRQIEFWRQKYDSCGSLTVNVNVAVQQFSYSRLIEEIDCILAETKLPPNCLKLEITESAIMKNSSAALEVLRQLRQRGITICLDDFGTGYSSLSYLHQFPVDNIKIDRSFVSRIESAQKPHKIIDAIVDLAHHLDMSVTAEGIENETQLEYLRHTGCEYAQGYYLSRPLNPEAIETTEIFQQRKSLFTAPNI